MNLILLIIRKFLASSKDKNEISKLSFFSYILVALGVAVPILVLSVTNGFQGMVEKRIINYDFHLQLQDTGLMTAAQVPEMEGISAWGFYEDKCLIKHRSSSQITQLRAFPGETFQKAPFFKSYKVLSGSVIPEPGGIVLSENLAANLRIGTGDKISIVAIDHSIGYNPFSTKSFTVTGIISLGYAPFDTIASFILKQDAGDLFYISPEAVNRAGIMINSENYRQTASKWVNRLRKEYPGKKVKNTFDNKVFRDFEEEKKSLTVAMLVIVFIAFIAIFMTLNVVLADKNVDVGLLRVIGLHRKRLVQIFLGQGFFIAFMGSLAGFFLGSLLVLNLDFIIRSFELMVNNLIYLGNFSGITAFPSYYRYEIMPQEVFYLTSLPYKLVLRDYLIQGIGTFILAMLASFSPALKVLKNNPAEILRNE